MKSVFILLSLVLACSTLSIPTFASFDIAEANGVGIVDARKFSILKYRVPFFMTYFYNETLPETETISKEFAQAATELSKLFPGVKFAKIDALTNESYVKQYNLTEADNMRFFIRSSRDGIKYEREKRSQDIVSWITEQIKSSIVLLSSPDEAQDYLSKNEDVVFYFGSFESDTFFTFLSVVSTFNEYNLTFASSDDESTKREFGAPLNEDTVVLFRNFTEERTTYSGSFDIENVVKFVKAYKYPTLMIYDRKARSRIQMSQDDAIILFKSKDENGERAEEAFRSIAEKYRGKMIFLYEEAESDPTKTFGRTLAGYLNLKDEDFPRMVILQGNKEMKKYLSDLEITEKNIEAFINNFYEGNLRAYYRTESVPIEDYDGDIRVVVGSNFKKVVEDETKDVLIAFYSPDCPYSKAFFKTYTKIAAKLNNFEDLVIAKVNVDKNEFENVNILGVPALRLYPRGRKDKPIPLSQPSFDTLIKLLKKYSTVSISKEFVDDIMQEKQKMKEKLQLQLTDL